MAEAAGKVVYAIITKFVEEGAAAKAFAAAAGKIIATVAYSAAINAATNALSNRPSGVGKGLEVTVNDPTAPGRMIVGQVRTAGVNIIPPFSQGGNGRYLHMQQAFAMHECEEVGNVFFDQNEVTGFYIAATTGTDNDGLVSGTPYPFDGYAWIRRYRGTSSQTADYILTQAYPSAFDANHRGRGVAHICLRLQYNAQKGTYATGVPNVTATIKGLKCYDPRKDSTNGGSGTHRYTDPNTWEYTVTPALHLTTFLMTTLSGPEPFPASEIDWPLVAAAANICEAQVAYPGGSTQARYTANGVLALEADSFERNVRTLVDAMMGRVVYRDGKWRIYAGAWTTPLYTLSSSDFIGPVTIRASDTREERWNGVRCFFVDRVKNYQYRECYARINDTYKTADGNERLYAQIERPLCNDEYEAQRNAEMFLRQSRNQIKVAGRLGPKWQRLALWETLSLNWPDMGWSAKTFRVIEMTIDVDGSVDVVLREEQATDWSDMAAAEYSTASTVTLPTVNPTTPDDPTNFSVTATVNGTLLFNWDRSVIEPKGTTYKIIRSTNSTNAAVGTTIWQGLSNGAELNAPTSRHWYWLQAQLNSYTSAFVPNTFGIAGAANSVTFTPDANLIPNGDFSQLDPGTNKLVGWVGSYAAAQSGDGIGGSVCMVFSETSTARIVFNAKDIPVAKFDEVLELTVWARAATSGSGVLVGLECRDEQQRYIHPSVGRVYGVLTPDPYRVSNAGVSTFAILKPSDPGALDPQCLYTSSFMYAIFCGTYGSPQVTELYPTTFPMTQCLIESINTTASTSFDIVKLANNVVLPTTVSAGVPIAVGRDGGTYSYMGSGTGQSTFFLPDTWTKYTAQYTGEKHWLERVSSHETGFFRYGTKFVRAIVLTGFGGPTTAVYFGKITLERKPAVRGVVCPDPLSRYAGAYKHYTLSSSASSGIRFWPTSGVTYGIWRCMVGSGGYAIGRADA